MSPATQIRTDPIRSVEITAADSDLTRFYRALYVGTGGNVKITDDDNNNVTYKNVPAGTILPIVFDRVWATGTTASDFVGGY